MALVSAAQKRFDQEEGIEVINDRESEESGPTRTVLISTPVKLWSH